MEMAKSLTIQGFKSIKHLSLGCRRVNVLIGEPNVGKSNIWRRLDFCPGEAMGGSSMRHMTSADWSEQAIYSMIKTLAKPLTFNVEAAR